MKGPRWRRRDWTKDIADSERRELAQQLDMDEIAAEYGRQNEAVIEL